MRIKGNQMNKLLAGLFGLVVVFLLHLAVMMWGWGLNVTSWGWIIGGFAGMAIVRCLTEIAKEVDK